MKRFSLLILEPTDELIGKYARMELSLSESRRAYRKIRQSEEAQKQVREIIAAIRDDAVRKQVARLHEFFEWDYNETVEAWTEIFGRPPTSD